MEEPLGHLSYKHFEDLPPPIALGRSPFIWGPQAWLCTSSYSMGQDHSKVTPTMGKGKENHINSQMVALEDVYWQTTNLIVSPAQQ